MHHRILALVLLSATTACSQPPASPVAENANQAPLTASPSANAPKPTPAPVRDGPFGLAMGMSFDDVVQAMGRQPLHVEDGAAQFDTAPRAHPELSDYLVMTSPTHGLCKVMGTSELKSNRFGHQVSEKVSMFVAALTEKYGNPTFTRDSVPAGSLWNKSEDYMMGLLQQDRVVLYLWEAEKSDLPGDLRAIAVTAEGLATDTARIMVGYEFTNMPACVEANQRASNESL